MTLCKRSSLNDEQHPQLIEFSPNNSTLQETPPPCETKKSQCCNALWKFIGATKTIFSITIFGGHSSHPFAKLG